MVWILDPLSEFFEICNSNILSVTKYKVAFRILTVISYDSAVLRLILKLEENTVSKDFCKPSKIQRQVKINWRDRELYQIYGVMA